MINGNVMSKCSRFKYLVGSVVSITETCDEDVKFTINVTSAVLNGNNVVEQLYA